MPAPHDLDPLVMTDVEKRERRIGQAAQTFERFTPGKSTILNRDQFMQLRAEDDFA